jgi:DNA-directed RNA polymerase subunit RPC12/RpoP
MSAVVIPMPERQPKAAVKPEVTLFYCLRCDTSSFRIQHDGGIFCNGCDARIRNLKALQS